MVVVDFITKERSVCLYDDNKDSADGTLNLTSASHNSTLYSITSLLYSQLVNSVKIRQFEQRDTDVVIQLANNFASFDGSTTEEDLKITHAFPEGFIVAEEDGNVVGLAYGHFRDVPEEVLDKWGVSKVATIELLVVDPKYRKHGIGTSLIDSLIGIFKKAGVDMIGLTSPKEAGQAKRLYEKIGFEISAYHMRKKLD